MHSIDRVQTACMSSRVIVGRSPASDASFSSSLLIVAASVPTVKLRYAASPMAISLPRFFAVRTIHAFSAASSKGAKLTTVPCFFSAAASFFRASTLPCT